MHVELLLKFSALQQWLALGKTLRLRGLQELQRVKRQQHNVGSALHGEARLQHKVQMQVQRFAAIECRQRCCRCAVWLGLLTPPGL